MKVLHPIRHPYLLNIGYKKLVSNAEDEEKSDSTRCVCLWSNRIESEEMKKNACGLLVKLSKFIVPGQTGQTRILRW